MLGLNLSADPLDLMVHDESIVLPLRISTFCSSSQFSLPNNSTSPSKIDFYVVTSASSSLEILEDSIPPELGSYCNLKDSKGFRSHSLRLHDNL
jgi:hypothetical protein